MTKIHIGKKGSRYGFWVAASPSDDASSEGDRMMLDSDRDAILLHHVASTTIQGVWDSSSQVYFFGGATINFPSLPYVPFANVMADYPGSAEGIVYPMVSFPGSPDIPGVPVQYRVFTNRVEIDAGAEGIESSTMRLTAYIYKNRMIG